MSAYKKLNKQDVFVTSYQANKQYSLVGNSDFSTFDVDKFLINSSSGEYYIDPFDSVTGLSGTSFNPTLGFKSVHQLYYSNFIATGSIEGEKLQSGSFENFIQSSISTGSYKEGYRHINVEGAVLSIPRKHFGTAIAPNSLEFHVSGAEAIPAYSGGYIEELSSYIETGSDGEDHSADDFVQLPQTHELIRQGEGLEYVDDGEGNLIISSSNLLPQTGSYKVGDVIYPHGIVIITSESVSNIALSKQLELKWKATQPIYTYNVRCKVKDYEMNFTQNPSAINGKEGLLHDNVTGSNFQPYITSVGLYNDANELLAVAKFGKPIPKSDSTETSFVIRLDM